jgi:TonB family protein
MPCRNRYRCGFLARLAGSDLLAAFFLLSTIAGVFLLAPSCGASSRLPLEDLSKDLRHKISDGKLNSVVVADLLSPDGTPAAEGIYFADLISLYLAAQPPRKFTVIDRDVLSHKLAVHKLTMADLTSTETLNRVGLDLHVDAFALGTVEVSAQRLVLDVSIKRALDGNVITEAKIAIDQSPFYASLSSYPFTQRPNVAFTPGAKDIRPALCLECPPPQFRGPADGANSSSTAVILLGLIVSAEGRIVDVQVVRGAGPEFRDIALRAIRAWRFKPATNKAGQPVAFTVPMDVTFSLY